MKKHEHHDCEHELRFCRPCNEVWCERCELTWEQPWLRGHGPWYYTYTSPDTSSDTITSDFSSASSHALHVGNGSAE